jgi:hypothetical protein|tara:strand:- start:424 stop:1224 length:801 start_codon:yes stop_codon:yes gene_type:complete
MSKRTNWKIEFSNLVASKRLIGRDRTFIESLYRHWSSGKAMTSGRKHHFFIVKERVAQLEARGDELSDKELSIQLAQLASRAPEGSWDRTFINSVSEQNDSGRVLSAKQNDILNKISERYSEESVKLARAWAGEYDEAKRLIAVRCARYYWTTGYYRDLADRIINDQSFVPTAKQYKSITANKYASKVLAGYAADAKYPIGTTVLPAAGCDGRTKGQLKRGGLVITTDEVISSACRGNRKYKVLPIGAMRPVLVEERHIKKHRGVS